MFDIATRPQSAPLASATGAAFDWCLTAPTAPQSLPYTDFSVVPPESGAQVLAVYALALEATLQTAVILSLFTDRRAGADDPLPGRNTRRRGWVGSEFMAAAGDPWGSLLWLGYSGKQLPNALETMRFWAQECLAWMVTTGVASKVEVDAAWLNDRLTLQPRIYQPDNPLPVYDVLWGTTMARGASA